MKINKNDVLRVCGVFALFCSIFLIVGCASFPVVADPATKVTTAPTNNKITVTCTSVEN